MRKSTILISSFILILIFAASGFSQIAGVTPVLIDSSTHFRIINGYRAEQNTIFYEPVTGNLVVSYYYIGTSIDDPNTRPIVAAVSLDDGATWTVYPNLNQGAGEGMNAYYPTAHGNENTPIVVYYNRANPEPNITSQPTMATDILGWGGGVWENTFVDEIGTPDTVLDFRYYAMDIAPDNPDLWLLGGIHYRDAAPGEYLSVYRSENGGITWSRPIPVISAVPADTNKSTYVYEMPSTSLAISIGTNNKVYAVAQANYYSSNDFERAVYVTSDDGGKTWSPPAPIPGTEYLEFSQSDIYRNFSLLIDDAGNWHVFAVGVDTSEIVAGERLPYRAWDCRFDGSTWQINKFVFPQVVNDGIVATGTTNSDEEDPMNSPALGPDGTLYFAYSDAFDTTGSGGDELQFKYAIFVMVSEDNGANWKGPVKVYEDETWKSDYPCDVARTASDKLHFVFRRGAGGNDAYKELMYIGVPTDSIKALLTSVPQQATQDVPKFFALYQNYPNPFNPTTTIRFNLKEDNHVTLKVYNTLGQQVATLIDKPMTAGYKGVVWDASNMPSGTYIYRLEVGDYRQIKEMTLIK